MPSQLVEDWSKQVAKLSSMHLVAERSHQKEKEYLKEAKGRLKDTEEAREIIQGVAQSVQTLAHTKLAGTVTRCLEAVFDDPYEFRMDIEKKRGKTEAELKLVRDGEEVDPMTGAGGGVVDVVSFALRVACLALGSGTKVLILDEPFRFLSAQYRPAIRKLLEVLAEEMEIQFIVVTHMVELECGKVVELAGN